MSNVVRELAISAALFVVGGWIGAGARAASLAARVGGALQSVAVMRGIGTIGAALTPRQQQLRTGMQVEYEGTVEARRIIYGEALVGGLNVIPPWHSGQHRDYLHQVLALAGHQVDGIPAVYLNREYVDSFGAVTGTNDDGLVSGGSFANRIWIRRYLGTATQAVDHILHTALPSVWTPGHRGRGVAYLALRYKFDAEVYRHGRPQVRALVRGKRCYDPRRDATAGGAGPHRLADPETWEWTDNPALITADYLIDDSLGLGEEPQRIDWSAVAAAASICDEQVPIPPGPLTTERRYRCSLVLDATAGYRQNIEDLVNSMAGYVVYSGGQWRIHAGAWRPHTFALGDDDLAGPIEVRTAIPFAERWNAVRGQYVDATRLHQPIEYPPVRNLTDEAADGEGPVWRGYNRPACTSVFQARRDASVLQRKSRRRMRIIATYNLRAYAIRPGDTGTITHPELHLSALSVRCIQYSLSSGGLVQLTLDEAVAADYADPARSDYVTLPQPVDLPPGLMLPDQVRAITVIAGVSHVLVSWLPPGNAVPGTLYQVWSHTASTPFAAAVPTGPLTAQSSIQIPRQTTAPAYYWVEAIFPSGASNREAIAGSGASGSALSVPAGFRVEVSHSSLGVEGPSSSLSAGPVAAVAIDPAGAVSWSWSRIAGDPSIAIDSPATASTTFSTTGLAPWEFREATFRVTGHDGSSSATADVSVWMAHIVPGQMPP